MKSFNNISLEEIISGRIEKMTYSAVKKDFDIDFATYNFENVIKNNDNSKGYIPLKGEWNGKEKVLKGDVFKISPELIKSVNGFISKAKSHNIKVVLVISPTFKKINPEFFKIANEIAILHGVKLISYYGDKDFILNKSLFHDSEHLNNKGAILFSQKVASQIKL
jgi:hypothetical protein